jgi:hypothetical protein
MPEKKTTKRKPLSEAMLIRYGRDWQVCYQARGKLGTQRVTAWVFGPASTFFCKVGDQAEIIMLPEKDACMGDQYHFTVDRTDQHGIPIERIGGATNVDAAIAVYEHFVTIYPYGVRLRNGARLMRMQDEENGK